MELKWGADGLVTAVIVHAATGEVLMVAHMNQEALKRTEESRETWFWSRSRQELWHKGATSGNTQSVLTIEADCDADALVVRVLPKGPACHRGTPTCFDGPTGGALSLLDSVLAQRAKDLPAGSYTTRLLQDPNLRIKKLGEETAEFIQAILTGEEEQAVDEASDLVYHLSVALRARGISVSRLQAKLLQRARGEK